MLVELWRIGVQAYASRTGGEVTLSRAACKSIAGREQHAHNLRAIRKLCARMGYAVREQGACISVSIRNLSTKQGFGSENVSNAKPITAASESDSEHRTPNTEAEKSQSAPPGASAPQRGKVVASDEARRLTLGFLDSIKAPLPDFKEPTPAAYGAWELETDRMLRLDPGRTPEAFVELVQWLFDPTDRASPDALFWRAHVQSPKALRAKWDRLQAVRARGVTSNGKARSTGNDRLAAAGEQLQARFAEHLVE